jgi:hypothetical protein
MHSAMCFKSGSGNWTLAARESRIQIETEVGGGGRG